MKLLIISLFLSLFLNINAKETIVWSIKDWPPGFILDGSFQQDGDYDRVLKLAKKLMPQYNHETMLMNLSRTLGMIKTQPNYCYMRFKKTKEREKFMYFSEPYGYFFSNVFAVNSKFDHLVKPFVDNNGHIDLEAVLKSGVIKIGNSPSRKYSKSINEILKKYKDNISIIEVQGGIDTYKKLIKRLIFNRGFQAVLIYPSTAEYIYKSMGSSNQQFNIVYYPIKGEKVLRFGSHVGCSKTPLGKKITQDFNHHIMKFREEYFNSYLRWLDEDTKRLYIDNKIKYFQQMSDTM